MIKRYATALAKMPKGRRDVIQSLRGKYRLLAGSQLTPRQKVLSEHQEIVDEISQLEIRLAGIPYAFAKLNELPEAKNWKEAHHVLELLLSFKREQKILRKQIRELNQKLR